MSQRPEFISDSAKARQRLALLAALRNGPVTTVQAREALGISHPGGRVLELRRRGLRINTVRGRAVDAQGRPHVSAVYVLVSGEDEGKHDE